MKKINIKFLLLLLAPTFLSAQGNALQFDGTDDFARAMGFSALTTYSIEAWVKFDVVPVNKSVILMSNVNGRYTEYSHQIKTDNSGRFQHYYYQSSDLQSYNITGTTVIEAGVWYHVAAVASSSGNSYLYVNGVEEGTSLSTGTLWNGGERFLIGSDGGYNSAGYFDGTMDELRIWNIARTAQEIQDNRFRGMSGRESGLVAYYTMNSNTGTTLYDQTSNALNATLELGPTWVVSNAGILPSKGNTLSFDGTNEGISVGASSTLNNLATSQFSFEAWINIPSSGEARSILRKTGDYNFFVYAQKLYIEIWPNGVGDPAWRQYEGTQTVSHNTWVHVAVSYNADVADFYINGVKETISGYAPGSNGNSENLFIGYSSIYSNFFNGSMDEVRIWNTARTEQQIQDHMNGALSGTESGLVAYYDFNGTTGNKLMDLSLNGNHGTLSNMENADWVASEIGWSNTAYIDNTVHFRTMSSPVTTSYADILAEVWLQGTGTTGGDYAGGTPNVWTWNNGASGDGAGNWTVVTDYTSNVSAGQGFLYYHFNKDSGPNGATNTADTKISVSGTENSNPTITVNTNTNGWTLVGNPFSQPIHWEAFATKTNLYADAQFYNGSTGAWVTTAATPSIAPFRAFFVRSTNSSGALSIGTAAQRAGSGFRGKAGSSVFELAITAKSGTYEDEAMLRFSLDGKTGNDWMDAKKLNPLSARYLAMPVYGEDELLAINSLPVPESEIQIPIGFDFTASGKVSLGLRKNALPDGWSAVLVDTKTGAKIPVETEFAYSFDHEFTGKVRSAEEIVGSPLEMKSVSEPRFTLLVTPSKTTSNEGGNLPAKLALEQNFPNPFNPSTTIRFALPQSGNVRLEVLNLLGQTVAIVTDGAFSAGNHAVSFDASKLSSGVYVYRIQTGGSIITRKMSLIK